MALFRIVFRSEVLDKDTNLTVIIPEKAQKEDIPALYLLHGMHGCADSWVTNTNIARFVKNRNIAVIMPEGENSFYVDMKYGEKYFTYISGELVDFTQKIFRVSGKREKNFIAGLSMGGYGAFRTALLCPEKYAAAASLSGCVDAVDVAKTKEVGAVGVAVWGENYQKTLEGTDADLFYLLDHFPKDAPKPRLFSACGTSDELYENNLSFNEHISRLDFEFEFHEGEGAHTWAFWNKWIVPAMDFMTSDLRM